MRAFEFLIICITALAFMLPTSPKRLWAAPILSICMLFAFLMHQIFESWHWQMVGVYSLAILVFLVRRYFPQILLFSWARAIFICCLTISLLPPVFVPMFQLPKPTGEFGIGFSTMNSLVDLQRSDFFRNEEFRAIVVQIYYPIDRKGRRESYYGYSYYIDKETSLAPLARLVHLPDFFFSHFRLIRLNAKEGAPLAAGQKELPLLIFSPGRGGFRNQNSVMVQELVSHGYIVACIDHPSTVGGVAVWNQMLHDDETENINVALDDRMKGAINPPWDDQVTKYLSQDVSFLIDELIKMKYQEENPQNHKKYFESYLSHIDFDKIGMFGVSLGGMVSAQSCSADSRIKSCLIMDAYITPTALRNGIRQPVMIITRPPSEMSSEKWPKRIIDLHQNTMHNIFDRASKDAYFLTINGAFHANFSDAWLYIYQPLGRWLGIFGPNDGAETQRITNQNAMSFFDKYLKDGDGEAIAQSHADNSHTLSVK